MKCRGYRKLIVLYLYRELADEKRRRLEEHLDRCTACRREVEAFRTVIDRAGEVRFETSGMMPDWMPEWR